MDAERDSVVRDYRERINDADRAILDAVNRRVELVHELHRHKRRQGYPTADPERERRLLERLQAANPGPLSDERLDQLYRLLLEVCTDEARRLQAEEATA